MKSKALSILAGGVMLATSSHAMAQQNQQQAQQVQTTDPRHPNRDFTREYGTKVQLNLNNDPVRVTPGIAALARCVAGKAKAKAGELLGGAMTDDVNYTRLTGALSKKYATCIKPDSVGASMAIINGALAEELLRMKQPALQDRVVPTDLAAAKAFYETGGGVTMDSLGRCLSVYSPGIAYRLLGTAPGSPEEQAVMMSLYASTPECGVRATPMDIAAGIQRSAVATGLYHWTHRS